jgi:hypothetical protein
MTDSGIKNDSGKPRMAIVFTDFAQALMRVGEVGTVGASKYTPHGWVTVPDAQERYTSAMIRHMLAHLNGEEQDAETQLLHLAHMAWNALAVLELEIEKNNKKPH